MLAVEPKADKQQRPSFFPAPWSRTLPSNSITSRLLTGVLAEFPPFFFFPVCFPSSLSTLFISAESSVIGWATAEYCLNCTANCSSCFPRPLFFPPFASLTLRPSSQTVIILTLWGFFGASRLVLVIQKKFKTRWQAGKQNHKVPIWI